MLAIANAQQRFKDSQKVARKRMRRRSRLAGEARRLRPARTRRAASCFWWKAIQRRVGETGARSRDASHHAAARKILNTWEADIGEVLQSKKFTTSALRSASIRLQRFIRPALPTRFASGGRRQRRTAHRHAAVRTVSAPLSPLVGAGHIYVCMPPLFRIDAGKEVFYGAAPR